MSVREDIAAARSLVARLGAELGPDQAEALARGPLSLLVASLVALVGGRRAEAAKLATRASSGARVLPLVDYGAGLILHVCGDLSTAHARLVRGLEAASGKVAVQIADATRALATTSADTELRRAMLERLVAVPEPRPGHFFELAELDADLGELDAMARVLTRLVEHGDPAVASRAWTMWTRRSPSPALAPKLDAWLDARADEITLDDRLALAWCWVELGAFDRAEALVEGRASVAIDLARARWSLWQGHDERVGQRCASLVEGELEPGDRTRAAWMAAVARARQGALAEGLADLDRVLADGCEDSEAWRCRVELGLHHGDDPDELRELLGRGQARRGDDAVVTELLENLLGLRVASVDDGRRHYRSDRGDEAARAMVPLLRPALARIDAALTDGLDAVDDASLEARLWSALDRLAGYREGRVAIMTGERHVAEPKTQVAGSSEREALRWLRAGRAERARACCDLGGDGRAAQLIRAEAAWRLGRPAQGLWIAVAMLDARTDELGAWALAGLCGDDELATTALARLMILAPVLVSRSASDPAMLEAQVPAPASVRALLEQVALELVDAKNVQADYGQGLVELRRVQGRELGRFVRGLARALGVDPRLLLEPVARLPEPAWLERGRRNAAHAQLDAARPPRAPHVRRQPSREQLTSAEIDHFVERGFLKLEACFAPAEVEAWVASANRRISSDPRRWVKDYNPEDRARALVGYDPDVPETWTRAYIDVRGEFSFFIEDRAPRAWAAIGDLLGGHDRVATWTWTDSAKPNFYPTDPSAREVRPDAETWHIDNPTTAMTLHDLTHGLICIVVLSSIGPGMGGTMVCPDSLGPVVRVLAEHPQGYDFVAPDAGAKITRHCHEFVEATGEPGDVYFLHPLLMHSQAPNPSGTVRWMSNPLVRVRRPLEVEPADPATCSPVELAIIQAAARRGP